MKTLEAKIRQKKPFLKTNELSIDSENHTRPVLLLPAQAGFASPSLPTGEGAAKTTTESTTQHAHNNHNSLPARLL